MTDEQIDILGQIDAILQLFQSIIILSSLSSSDAELLEIGTNSSQKVQKKEITERKNPSGNVEVLHLFSIRRKLIVPEVERSENLFAVLPKSFHRIIFPNIMLHFQFEKRFCQLFEKYPHSIDIEAFRAVIGSWSCRIDKWTHVLDYKRLRRGRRWRHRWLYRCRSGTGHEFVGYIHKLFALKKIANQIFTYAMIY